MTDTTTPTEPAPQPDQPERETPEPDQPEQQGDQPEASAEPQRYDAPNQQVVRDDESGPGRPGPTFTPTATVDGMHVELDIPADIKTLSVEVDWGDGTQRDYWGDTTEMPNHTYTEPGTYHVRVDPFGDDETEATVSVTVEGEAEATPEQPDEPEQPEQPDEPDEPDEQPQPEPVEQPPAQEPSPSA